MFFICKYDIFVYYFFYVVLRILARPKLLGAHIIFLLFCVYMKEILFQEVKKSSIVPIIEGARAPVPHPPPPPTPPLPFRVFLDWSLLCERVQMCRKS